MFNKTTHNIFNIVTVYSLIKLCMKINEEMNTYKSLRLRELAQTTLTVR